MTPPIASERRTAPTPAAAADDEAVADLQRWAASGAMWLTGDEAPDPTPAGAFAAFADEVAATAAAIALPTTSGFRDAGLLLAGRAALLGRERGGGTSLNGATRLLRTPAGWWAVSLARQSDVELVPALLERELDAAEDPWPILAAEAARRGEALAERAESMGMPSGMLGASPPRPTAVSPIAHRRARGLPGALVVDLSSLWAGPLAGAMLAAGGAIVVKVEWTNRPDGARSGDPAFFDWLNGGKLSLAIGDDADLRLLSRLLDAADIVLESSRPRALRGLGLAHESREPRPGRIWARITAHGADARNEHRSGFGDDAAVSGGLVGAARRDPGSPVFIADAVADPLTGVRVAGEIAAAIARGGGELLDIDLAGVAAGYAGQRRGDARVRRTANGWTARVGRHELPVARPRRPAGPHPSAGLGADRAAVGRLLDRSAGA